MSRDVGFSTFRAFRIRISVQQYRFRGCPHRNMVLAVMLCKEGFGQVEKESMVDIFKRVRPHKPGDETDQPLPNANGLKNANRDSRQGTERGGTQYQPASSGLGYELSVSHHRNDDCGPLRRRNFVRPPRMPLVSVAIATD